MDLFRKKPAPPAEPPERRRISSIVHDDRGNASVVWRDAPADFERPVFEIVGARDPLQRQVGAYDPYDRAPDEFERRRSGSTSRTDLRKLSEWIKMMRELEARKKTGGDEEP